jgi:hypothetical protein
MLVGAGVKVDLTNQKAFLRTSHSLFVLYIYKNNLYFFQTYGWRHSLRIDIDSHSNVLAEAGSVFKILFVSSRVKCLKFNKIFLYKKYINTVSGFVLYFDECNRLQILHQDGWASSLSYYLSDTEAPNSLLERSSAPCIEYSFHSRLEMLVYVRWW